MSDRMFRNAHSLEADDEIDALIDEQVREEVYYRGASCWKRIENDL